MRVFRGGSSTDVPSGSARNTGFEPGEGAGGSSRTKHTAWGSRADIAIPGNGSKVTPVQLRAVRVIESPMRGPPSSSATSSPTFSRYQRTDRRILDVNVITVGVVGAAVVQGPNSPVAHRISMHSKSSARHILRVWPAFLLSRCGIVLGKLIAAR